MRRNWLGRSALVLLPAAAAGALTAVATQPSAAYQASPAYHVSSAFYAAPAAPVAARLTASTESIGNRILDEAETRTGDWYSYGSAGPSTFDCSGLVMWAFAQEGISLPHYTGDQWNAGMHVSRADLEPGDLVFFFADISHVGLYLGNGLMVDAPSTGQVVQVQPVFWSDYVGAVRIA